MYKGVNGGRWSVVTGLAVVTALYITVASLVKSKSNALLYCSPLYTVRFCISTVRVEVIVWLVVVLTFLFLEFIDRWGFGGRSRKLIYRCKFCRR